MIASRLIRRSFATTPRLLQKPSDKPPAPPPAPHNNPPDEPPPPRNDKEPPKTNPSAAEEFQKLKQKLAGTFKPSSEDFLLAFANPKLANEKRWKSFLLFSAATILALLIPDPFQLSGKQSEKEQEQKDTMVEMIQTAFVEKDRMESERRIAKP